MDAFSIRLHLLHVSLLIRAKVGEDGLRGIARGRFILFCIVPMGAFPPLPIARGSERNGRGNYRERGGRSTSISRLTEDKRKRSMSYRAARDPPLRKIQLDGRNKFSRWLAHASSPPRLPHRRSTLASFLLAIFVSRSPDRRCRYITGVCSKFDPTEAER